MALSPMLVFSYHSSLAHEPSFISRGSLHLPKESMLTLFLSITGGLDYKQALDPLRSAAGTEDRAIPSTRTRNW